MPIYEYQCEACQSLVEVMQKSTEPAPANCEKCGKGPMIKQLSLSGFALKGTGWYVTDFKGGSSGSAKPSSDKSSSDS
jgi:putative FmdB family regulatory protein